MEFLVRSVSELYHTQKHTVCAGDSKCVYLHWPFVKTDTFARIKQNANVLPVQSEQQEGRTHFGW